MKEITGRHEHGRPPPPATSASSARSSTASPIGPSPKERSGSRWPRVFLLLASSNHESLSCLAGGIRCAVMPDPREHRRAVAPEIALDWPTWRRDNRRQHPSAPEGEGLWSLSALALLRLIGAGLFRPRPWPPLVSLDRWRGLLAVLPPTTAGTKIEPRSYPHNRSPGVSFRGSMCGSPVIRA